MEMILKITECTGDSLTCLEEVATLITESMKRNEVLIKKGRTKIDMVGENCNVEILIKDNKQLSLTENK